MQLDSVKPAKREKIVRSTRQIEMFSSNRGLVDVEELRRKCDTLDNMFLRFDVLVVRVVKLAS
jgi:hypothetical protein